MKHVFAQKNGSSHPHCVRCHVPEGSAEAAWNDGECKHKHVWWRRRRHGVAFGPSRCRTCDATKPVRVKANRQTRLNNATIKLRQAAEAWTKGLTLAVIGPHDKNFRELDAALRRAALAYADASRDTSEERY